LFPPGNGGGKLIIPLSVHEKKKTPIKGKKGGK